MSQKANDCRQCKVAILEMLHLILRRRQGFGGLRFASVLVALRAGK